MGQKTNPNIFRLGFNKNWKTEYFEKKPQELPDYTFKDLEIRSYIERFLETRNLLLHDYKIHYSNAVINIYVSYFVMPNFVFEKVLPTSHLSLMKKNGSQRVIVKSFNKIKVRKAVAQRSLLLEKDSDPLKESKILFQEARSLHKIKKYLKLKGYTSLTTSNLSNVSTESNPNLDSKLNQSKLWSTQNLNDLQMENNLQKLLKGLSLFTKKRYDIITTFRCVNKTFDLTIEQTQSLKEKFMLLQKFRNIPFFKESIDVLFISIFNPKSANLLAKLISLQFKVLKRHNFFLSFLKRTLTIFIASNFSKVKGIKIVVKGRLNGAPRARHKILTIGSVPVQTISSNMDYAQSNGHNSNGSYGIKVWVLGKF